MNKGILLLTFGLLCSLLNAQSERKFVRQGNKNFEQKAYTESEIKYRKAMEEKSDYYDALYNLGDALYKQENYQDAIEQFQSIVRQEDISEDIKAKAYHNMGNALLESKKLKESIEAYKNSLKLNPDDIETKHNLTYAMNQLQKQKNQDKKNQNKQKQKDKNNQDQKNKNNKDQNKKDQQQNNQKQNQQKQDKQDKEQQQKNQPQQQEQQGKISKEEAKRLLQALENDEKKLQEKLKKKKAKSKSVKVTKDW